MLNYAKQAANSPSEVIKKERNKETNNILKIVLGILAGVFVLLYYSGLYFGLSDDEDETENNRKN